jgi:hypothetical protein
MALFTISYVFRSYFFVQGKCLLTPFPFLAASMPSSLYHPLAANIQFDLCHGNYLSIMIIHAGCLPEARRSEHL